MSVWVWIMLFTFVDGDVCLKFVWDLCYVGDWFNYCNSVASQFYFLLF